MNIKLKSLYFSPTRTTAKVVNAIAKGISDLGDEKIYDITLPEGRKETITFNSDDCLIIGLPVYGGRIPEFITPYIESLKGNKTPTIIATVYGNRHYDDALIELKDILDKNGFVVFGAGAFIAEHSYTKEVGRNRPDIDDLNLAENFGKDIAKKIIDNNFSSIKVNGNVPYKERKPSNPLAPITDERCNMCGICADNCPTYAIDFTDFTKADVSKCIKCHNCVKICPVGAKTFQSEWIDNIVESLVVNCSTQRRKPELFI